MTTVLLVSATLLVLSLGLKHYEFVRGQRVFEHTRVRLDRTTNKANARVVSSVRHGIEYVHKDVFLNGLHMVMYVALLLVRFIENKLERITAFLRSFKKREGVRTTSTLLGSIRRERRK